MSESLYVTSGTKESWLALRCLSDHGHERMGVTVATSVSSKIPPPRIIDRQPQGGGGGGALHGTPCVPSAAAQGVKEAGKAGSRGTR